MCWPPPARQQPAIRARGLRSHLYDDPVTPLLLSPTSLFRSAHPATVPLSLNSSRVNSPLWELLAVDHRQALDFFAVRLHDVTGPDVDREELLYNASVLAHYAQVSTRSDVELAAPTSLSVVFDLFVADTT